MCKCLKITYTPREGFGPSRIVEVEAIGTYNGYNYFEWTIGTITFTLWHAVSANWYVTTDGLGGLDHAVELKTGEECPLAAVPEWLVTGDFYEYFQTELCDECSCGITFTIVNASFKEYVFELNPTGTIINGHDSYVFSADMGIGGGVNENYVIYFNGTDWVVEGDINGVIFTLYSNANCPFVSTVPDLVDWLPQFPHWTMTSEPIICADCSNEDRIFKSYKSIKLPQTFVEQDRGLIDCCCTQLVLGGKGESWQNDLTSMWIKLSDSTDILKFLLLDCNQNVITGFDPIEFPNEPNAFYCTVNWNDILINYGQGSYTLAIAYSISGVSGLLLWGDYKLLPYSIQNALKTARVRAIFNGKQTIDGIDFTNSNVQSTHRFYGYIGNRQPNMQIDNLIYDNREMKRVIRENLNDYEIITDPEDECILRPLLELFLISENQLFISDYNAHNHSYRYLDMPAIVSESPTVEYKDFSRKAVLKCKVADKFKKQRTFY